LRDIFNNHEYLLRAEDNMEAIRFETLHYCWIKMKGIPSLLNTLFHMNMLYSVESEDENEGRGKMSWPILGHQS